jgi:alpha-tubulin suppressor-like RCC1 family protein
VTKASGGFLTGVNALSAAEIPAQMGFFYSCAATNDGSAWCWGYNADGGLGDGTRTDRHRAVRVTRAGGGYLTGVRSISRDGSQVCAVTIHGAGWCWGTNSFGALGDGTTIDRDRAVRVTRVGGGSLIGVTSIATGVGHTCAVTIGGVAWCWGLNDNGQLGDRTTTERHGAVRVTLGGNRLTGVTAIAAGEDDTCVLTGGVAIKCWGANRFGMLGNGTTTDSLTPVNVLGLE